MQTGLHQGTERVINMQTFISLNQFACFKKEINLLDFFWDFVNQLISSITACESAGLKDDRLLSVDQWAWMKGAILIGFIEHFFLKYIIKYVS